MRVQSFSKWCERHNLPKKNLSKKKEQGESPALKIVSTLLPANWI